MRTQQVEVFVYRMRPKGAEYLILKRIPAKGGFWQPVTGGVEPGETLGVAAGREVREETQLRPLSIQQLPYSFSFTGSEGTPLTEFVFAAMVGSDQEPTIGDEHTRRRWVDYSTMRKMLNFSENKTALDVVHEYLERRE